jgi:hypothetical protein
MSDVKLLRFQGTVSRRSEASDRLKRPGDAVLIKRGRPRLFLLSCPCGCGESFPINLDPQAGPAWRLYRDKRFGLSLFPSVWRDSGCRSHYIIWRDKIWLFGRYGEDDFDTPSQLDAIKPLTAAVLRRLPSVGLIAFSEIAEALGLVPWDVLIICRQLVRQGLAREGTGKQHGSFGKRIL